tara:strand:+ start:556 stop:810 length:255 start_codon:yes stop_codon:yes gene_type:complete
MSRIIWGEDGEEGTGPRGEYISLWAPGYGVGWEIRIAVSEEDADVDNFIAHEELTGAPSLADVQAQAWTVLEKTYAPKKEQTDD